MDNRPVTEEPRGTNSELKGIIPYGLVSPASDGILTVDQVIKFSYTKPLRSAMASYLYLLHQIIYNRVHQLLGSEACKVLYCDFWGKLVFVSQLNILDQI